MKHASASPFGFAESIQKTFHRWFHGRFPLQLNSTVISFFRPHSWENVREVAA
jgi:hypothetical protein